MRAALRRVEEEGGLRDRIAQCVEDASVSGDSAEQGVEIAELMDVLRRLAP